MYFILKLAKIKTTRNFRAQINRINGYFLLNKSLDLEEQKIQLLKLIQKKIIQFSIYWKKNNVVPTIYTTEYWQDPDSTNKFEQLLEQKKTNQNKLHEEEVKKRELKLKIGLHTYQLLDLEDSSERNMFFRVLKNIKHKDLENMVFGKSLTYIEIEYIL